MTHGAQERIAQALEGINSTLAQILTELKQVRKNTEELEIGFGGLKEI